MPANAKIKKLIKYSAISFIFIATMFQFLPIISGDVEIKAHTETMSSQTMIPSGSVIHNSYWEGYSSVGYGNEIGKWYDAIDGGNGVFYNFDHAFQVSYLVGHGYTLPDIDVGWAGIKGPTPPRGRTPGTPLDLNYYYNYTSHYIFPQDQNIMTSVKIIAVSQTYTRAHEPQWGEFTQGRLSYVISTVGPKMGYPWLSDPGNNPIEWVNSTSFGLGGFSYSFIGDDFLTRTDGWNPCAFVWDVTALENWTGAMVKSNDLYIMYTIQGGFRLDYLGIQYSWLGDSFFFPSIGEQTTIAGFIWLLILFIPPMLIGQIIPKVGFSAGMFLMLIILGISQPGFMATSLIGMIALAIMLYKG